MRLTLLAKAAPAPSTAPLGLSVLLYNPGPGTLVLTLLSAGPLRSTVL